MDRMSGVKDPAEKKRLSLKLDRRNVYGENDKSSRKNIPRGKRRRHKGERRGVGQALRGLRGDVGEDEATNAEMRAKSNITYSKGNGFKKRPDAPLGAVLAAKRAGKRKGAARSF